MQPKKLTTKKRKYTTTKPVKKYIKKDKLHPWAPKVSLKDYKFFDIPTTALSFSTVALGSSILWMNRTGPGDWVQNRIGNSLIMKSIHLKGFIAANGAPTTPIFSTVLRMSLVYDKSPNNSTNPAPYNDVFSTNAYNGVISNDVLSNINITNRSRFIILRDYIRVTPRTQYAEDGVTPIYQDNSNVGACGQGSEKSGQSYYIDDYIKLDLPSVWRATPVENDTYANLTTGALLLYATCGTQTANYIFNVSARIVFKEEHN